MTLRWVFWIIIGNFDEIKPEVRTKDETKNYVIPWSKLRISMLSILGIGREVICKASTVITGAGTESVL